MTHEKIPALTVTVMVTMLCGLVVPARGQRVALESDQRALAIADEAITALGGRDAWERTRFIRFTFVRDDLRLTLTWDKWLGRYRLDGTNEAGTPYVVLMTLETKRGQAFLDRTPLDGRPLEEYLDLALRVWAGETYWLLMPYKLRDPGVVLSYDGEETVEGVTYDKLHLQFDRVGRTPGDQFWAYINRTTHLMDRWKYRLQSGSEGDFWWRGWQRYGDLLLAPVREHPDGAVAIRMEDITITDAMPDTVFTSPDPVVLP